MAKSTRFATTVTTRNLMTPQGFDGFYLDGRISGPRDARGGDSTLDREDRGFFYALYSNNGADIKQTALRNKKHLDKIFEDVKIENRYNIDYEINELADCAVNIAGRLTLNDQQLPPYFTGIVVKDGEMAAITSGRGCAYLYRNDILYPLTKDEYPLSDVDLNGNKVQNADLYVAGLAGTIRYSNIAQLQPDDCFILCNKEVMETIGHHNMLRILDECYDQQDVAARVQDEMARQNPGATMQFMIGYVENITTLDKAGLKSLTGRMGWTQKTPVNLGGAVKSEPTVQPVPAQPSYMPLEAEASPAGTEDNLYVQQPAVAPYPEAVPGQANQKQLPYMPQNDRILQGVEEEEEGLSTAKKVIIAIMLAIIVLLGAFLAYLAFGGSVPTFGAKPTVTPTISRPTEAPVVLNPTNRPRASDLMPISTRPSAERTEEKETKPTTSQPESTTPSVSKPEASKPASTGGLTKYTVKSGDTLWGIASAQVAPDYIADYMDKIIKANPDIATADKTNIVIFPGDEINLPNP